MAGTHFDSNDRWILCATQLRSCDLAKHIAAGHASGLLIAFVDRIGIQAIFELKRFPRRQQLGPRVFTDCFHY